MGMNRYTQIFLLFCILKTERQQCNPQLDLQSTHNPHHYLKLFLLQFHQNKHSQKGGERC